jgi:hypothetical protein
LLSSSSNPKNGFDISTFCQKMARPLKVFDMTSPDPIREAVIKVGATVRLSYSVKLAVIQQCFSLTINQQTVLSATINQRNE